MKRPDLELSVKDLVTIYTLTILIFVASRSIELLAMPHAPVHLGLIIAAILEAPLFFLMVFKVDKHGVLLIHSLMRGILYALMGYPQMIIVLLPLGIVGELILSHHKEYCRMQRMPLIFMAYLVSYTLYKIILAWLSSNYLKHAANYSFPDLFKLLSVCHENILAIAAFSLLSVTIAFVGSWFLLQDCKPVNT